MSRWHDTSEAGIANWANLTPDERFTDRLADIACAVDELSAYLTLDVAPAALGGVDVRAALLIIGTVVRELRIKLLPAGGPPPGGPLVGRAPDLARLLDELRRRVIQCEDLPAGPEQEITRRMVEAFAAPFALAFARDPQHRSEEST